jgi:hypothetical protein
MWHSRPVKLCLLVLQLELTIDDVKWAIVSARKLKIKHEVEFTPWFPNKSLTLLQSITIIPKRNRLRIYIDGNDKYYRLRDLKRVLAAVVVKVRLALSLMRGLVLMSIRAFPQSVVQSSMSKTRMTSRARRVTRNCSSRAMVCRRL